jgi:hypothetical protein
MIDRATDIDTDRLAEIAEGRHRYDRQAGRTTAMLVEAIQQSDFPPADGQDVWIEIVGAHTKQARWLRDKLLSLAIRMGYRARIYKLYEVRIGERFRYLFTTTRHRADSHGRSEMITFRDHLAAGVY